LRPTILALMVAKISRVVPAGGLGGSVSGKVLNIAWLSKR
jgi:hypothetical protein